MTKTKKSSKGLALVLAAVLALTPMAGFPITALATGEAAAPKAEAPATDAAEAPAIDADETPQVDAPAADADANTDTAPGTTPSTPAVDAEAPQAEAPATDAGTNLGAAGSVTNAVTPDLTPTPTVDPDAANDGVVNEKDFPDPNFWTYVQQEFDTNENQALEADEIEAAKTIEFTWGGLTTLQGVEHFTALTSLTCRPYEIGTLDLTKNTALTTLDCGIPYDGSGDLSPGNLTTLDVSANTALTSLYCGGNQLTNLDVSANTALTELVCYSNKLTNLDVSANTALTVLGCGGNQLTNLDVSANTALTDLACFDNQLTTLDVSANTALTDLGCFDNQLTTLDVSANTALFILACFDNQLTTLDVSANTALGQLLCANNQLTTLDTFHSPGLGLAMLSPQAPQIPVVKRGAQYELDIKALAKGQMLTAITLDGAAVELADYEKKRDTAPKDLQYTCITYSQFNPLDQKAMEVVAAGFDLYHPATLVTDANGTLTCDVASPTADELLLRDGSTPTFTVTPASGYQVATLTVNGKDAMGSLVGETLTLPPVTDTVAIAATFKEIPPTPIVNHYSVTATAENGTITPEHPTTVREGSSVKCTFSPKEGYTLESVSVNGELVKATDDSTATTKTYSYNINNIYNNTTIHVIFKAVEPPVDPTDPVDPPKPPVDPTDPVDPPKPPVDPADPINPPTPPAVPDNGGNGNNNGGGGNNGGGTTIVERTNTVTVPAAPQAAAPETPATPAAAAAKTEAAPAQAAADTATTQGQLENPALGAQAFDMQHSHLPLALLLLAVWLVGGFAVIRQRKHTHDAMEGTSY